MSELSEALQRLCNDTGNTNTALARRAGIDRPTFIHFLSGRRRPTTQNLEDILLALQATPAQRREVLKLYTKERVDPGLRHQRKAVATLLTQIFAVQESHNNPTAPRTDATMQNLLCSNNFVELTGKTEIAAALQQLLQAYCRHAVGPVMLPPGLSSEWIAQIAHILANTQGRGEIWHLSTFLKRTAQREDAAHNLATMADAVPLTYLSNMKYEARFTYAIDAEPLPGTLFSMYIALPEALLLIGRDSRNAWVVRKQEVVNAARRVFAEDYQEACDYLQVGVLSAEGRQARVELNSKMDRLKRHTWNLRREPQIVSQLDDAMLAEYALVSPEREPELYELLFRRVHEIIDLPLDCYFTLEGAAEFMQTGLSYEIPSSLYRPLPPEKRLVVLDRIIEKIETDQCADRLLDSRCLAPPIGFYLTAAEGYGVNFYQAVEAHGGEQCRVTTLSEPETSEAIFDFLRNLPQTGCAFGKDETLDQLRRLRNISASAL